MFAGSREYDGWAGLMCAGCWVCVCVLARLHTDFYRAQGMKCVLARALSLARPQTTSLRTVNLCAPARALFFGFGAFIFSLLLPCDVFFFPMPRCMCVIERTRENAGSLFLRCYLPSGKYVFHFFCRRPTMEEREREREQKSGCLM